MSSIEIGSTRGNMVGGAVDNPGTGQRAGGMVTGRLRMRKGYLPKAPRYDAERQMDPRGFHVYKRNVECFVEIATAVSPEEQIGAREIVPVPRRDGREQVRR